MSERLPRKLTAILYADVAGYSRLTGEDEEGTHRRLSTYLDLIGGAVGEHGGAVVHYAGDAVLADFGSVSSALTCALAVQRELAARNHEIPDARRLEFRIGLNLGEVIVDRDEIWGDGVNVAARLESLADPGGICISGAVRDAIGDRLPATCEFMGEQTVKNIRQPVRAYRVRVESPTTPAESRGNVAGGAPPRPSVAVLPFTNLSGDPEQEYFSDGMTEDIITGLSRFREVVVIARSSSFVLKGENLAAAEAASRLGVEYVLEGSVRKAGSRVRVTARLLRAADGQPAWAESYDRLLEDVFEVQDDVTQQIVVTLAKRLEGDARRRAMRKAEVDLSAYDCLLRGKQHFQDFDGTAADNARARQMYERALALDPAYGAAHACLAETYLMDFEHRWGEAVEAAGERAIELARKAIELDELDSQAHLVLAAAYFQVRNNTELARTHVRRALQLNPNEFWNYCFNCWFSTCTGELEEAITCGLEAVRRSPFLSDGCLRNIGLAEYLSRRYDNALATLQRIAEPKAEALALLAACYARLGRDEEAGALAAKYRQRAANRDLSPETSRDDWRRFWTGRKFDDPASLEHLLDGFQLAGLFE